MAKYRVKCPIIGFLDVTVEASDPQDARHLAWEHAYKGEDRTFDLTWLDGDTDPEAEVTELNDAE